jgi:hypothetical protein
MVRRVLLCGAILLLILLLVPACGSQRDTSKGGTLPPDQPLPEPSPAGKSG